MYFYFARYLTLINYFAIANPLIFYLRYTGFSVSPYGFLPNEPEFASFSTQSPSNKNALIASHKHAINAMSNYLCRRCSASRATVGFNDFLLQLFL